MHRHLNRFAVGFIALACSASVWAALATQADVDEAKALYVARQIDQNVPKHLQLARQVADNVKPENNEHYSAGKRSLCMPGEFGAWGEYRVKTDCIGFVEEMVQRAYGKMPQPSTKKFKTRYSINDYVDAVDNNEFFTKLPSVTDFKPGDFLMWKFLVKKEGQTTNGHIQIVDSIPEKMGKSRLKGYTQWRVWVVDDSGHPTNPGDARYSLTDSNLDLGNNFDEKSGQTGVGRGFIYLYADESGAVEAVSYGFKKSGIYHQAKWHILMARMPQN